MMNRGYTIEKYKKLIEGYRKLVSGAQLSTDVIVGFPTETEEDFQMTKKVIEEIRFNNAYIFKYSPRPPAKSAELADDVPRQIKEKRHSILLELQKKISAGICT
jgi:tRNA-2-methylthio-N6-dimethylallyladenosine synthase